MSVRLSACPGIEGRHAPGTDGQGDQRTDLDAAITRTTLALGVSVSTTSTAEVTAAAGARTASPARRRLAQLSSGTGGAFIGLIVLCIALFIASPYFLTVNNLLNVLDQVTILGILALGMTLVIVTGGI